MPLDKCCQKLTKVKFFLCFLFLFFFLSAFSSFPAQCLSLLLQQHLGHLPAHTGSYVAREELVAHHPSSIIISSSIRFRQREGGMCGELRGNVLRAKNWSQGIWFQKQSGAMFFFSLLSFSFPTFSLSAFFYSSEFFLE